MRTSLAFIVLVALILAPLTSPAAQALATCVSFVPATTTIDPGQSLTVEVRVEGVTNLYGVDIHMSFDPSVLEVQDADGNLANGTQISRGSFLAPNHLFVVHEEALNSAGVITYTATMLYPATPVSGSGTVATISFRGKGAGTSALTFTRAALSNQYGEAIAATASDATIVVRGSVTPAVTPSATATTVATATRTPTATPTSTQDPSLSPTATRTATLTPSPSPTRSATPTTWATATHTTTPTPTATPTQVPLLAEERAMRNAAAALGWAQSVVLDESGYRIEQGYATASWARAWIRRLPDAAAAAASFEAGRRRLVGEGWLVSPLSFHDMSGYAGGVAQAHSPAMTCGALSFVGSAWVVDVRTCQEGGAQVPDVGSIAEAVYQAGLAYHFFAGLEPYVYLPIVQRGHGVIAPTPMPSTTPTATTVPSATPTRTETPPTGATATRTATASPTASATASATPTATPTASATSTPTGEPPTETPLPPATPTSTATVHFDQLVVNPGFETEAGWLLMSTGEGYAPVYTVSRRLEGQRSLRLGSDTASLGEGWSIAEQSLALPAGTTSATLSLGYFPLCAPGEGDAILVRIISSVDGSALFSDRWLSYASSWQSRSYGLLEWAGQSVRLQIAVYNDGLGGMTAAYVDDVQVRVTS